jgi:hypothetical protein
MFQQQYFFMNVLNSKIFKMKTRNLLPAIILLTISFSVFGQEQESKTIKRISIHDIYIQTGWLNARNANAGTLTDFKALAPQSVLLKNDLTAYSQYGGSSPTSGIFSVMLGIQFSDKQKKSYKANPLLRLGIIFSGTNLTNELYKEDSKRYDTLTSSRTGQTTYVDSIHSKSYNMNYTSQQLRFDGSIIFRTNPQARWSLFTGIGITAGFSFNTYTNISYNTSSYSSLSGLSSLSSYSYPYSTENYKNKTNFGFSSYIPMGINFRIGKKREFWKHTHLFFELRPGINVTSIPELSTYINPSMQYGFGLKYSWN